MCHFTFFLILLIAYQSPKNASEIDKLNKDLQSHNASLNSLETLKELCGYAEKINQNHVDEQSCKNFLESLCTGLEKFLGYQNGNYTGEGIVYSDLDRLCDGVMSFLHGVLSNIKPKLGLHSNEINEAIRLLEANKHSGKDGFNAAIGEVVQGVNKYNEGVKKSNQEVKEIMTKMQGYTRQEDGKLINGLHAIQVENNPRDPELMFAYKDVNKALQECQAEATKFTDSLNISDTNNKHKDAVNDLNDTLKVKLNNLRSTIVYETGRLGKVQKQEEKQFEERTAKIAEVLKALGTQINKHICREIERFVEDLKPKVQKILDELKKIDKRLQEYVKELEAWIESALQVIKSAEEKFDEISAEANEEAVSKNPAQIRQVAQELNTRLEGEIEELKKWREAATEAVGKGIENCDLILERVQNGHPKNRQNNGGLTFIKKKAEELKTQAEKLRLAAEGAMRDVKDQVAVALNEVMQMDMYLKRDLKGVKDDIKKGITQEITKLNIAQLEGKVIQDLGTLKQKIESAVKDYVKSYVDAIKTKVGVVKDGIGDTQAKNGPGNESIFFNWNGLKHQITWLVGGLTNEGPVGTGKLQEIVHGILSYAKEFGSGKFETQILTGWLKEILEDTKVNRNITTYVSDNRDKGKFIGTEFNNKGQGDKILAVKEAIKSKLPEELKASLLNVAGTSNRPGAKVSEIAQRFKEFAQQVETDLKDKASQISEKVEEHLGLKTLNNSTDKTGLLNALKTILPSIAAVARKFAEEIQKFLEKSKIGYNLEPAIKKVGEIVTKLGDPEGSTNQPGSKITKALKEVQPAINLLYSDLGTALGQSAHTTLIPPVALTEPIDTTVARKIEEGITSTTSPLLGTSVIPQQITYELGEKHKLMQLFKTHYSTINSALSEPTFGGQVDSILDQEIGGNAKVGSTITELAKTKFNGYKHYVDEKKLKSALGTGKPQDIQSSGELPQSIKRIETTGVAELEKTIGESAGPDKKITKDTFEKPVQTIDAQLTYLTQLVNRDRADDYGNKGVQTILNELKVGLTKQSLGTANGLQQIQENLTDLHNQVPHISAKLVSMCSKINTAVHFGKESIKTLRDTKIKQQLKNIRNNLTKLQNDLVTKPIKLTETFISSIGHYRQATIQLLETHVNKEVDDATKQLTVYARKQYVESIKFLLKAFAEKVTEELKTLPDEIGKDLEQGHKKFMELFAKDVMRRLEGINEIDPNKFTKAEPPLHQAATKLNSALNALFKKLKSDEDLKSDHDKVAPSKDALTKILNGLMRSRHFDNNFSTHLVTFNKALTEFNPKTYGEGKYPFILESFKRGFAALFTELEKAYVNVYDGHPKQINLSKLLQDKPQKDPSTPAEKVLTPDGENMSKVFLSILEIISEDLTYLKTQCLSEWYARRIHSGSSLGTFLQTCGYRVVTNRDSQNGELQYTNNMKGEHIYGRLVGDSECVFDSDKDAKRALDMLNDCLTHYYSVSHIATSFSKKRPCFIYEMLAWCTSLLHHPVYIDLTTNDFSHLFDKPKRKEADNVVDDISLEEPSSLSLAAYPQKIAQSEIHDAIVHVTSLAPVILTTIVGYGDEFTTYAVDYHTNALGFTFPSSAGDCLNMLLECLRRMFPVFRFLHHQCTNLVSEHGWYSCKYGKDVKSAKWPCSDHSNSKPNGQPNCKPNHQPNGQANCQPRSPLMSYLNDCLPGHLPHQVSAIGCKAPCLTPLGFRGFSGSTKTGKDLCKVLTKFFGNGVASPLLSVAPKPPSNLAEHIQFALSFVKGWSHNGGNGLKTVVENSAKSVSIDLYNEPSKLTDALRDAYRNAHGKHGGKDHLTAYADVSSIAMTQACNDTVGKALCAPYVASLCGDTYAYFAEKHCNTYLSWAIYLPWTFWDLLNNLYNAFCQITCADWECRGCLRGGKCKSGKHGVVEDEKKPDDTCQCPSIVTCRGVAPTLYQYGFSFGEASTLNGKAPKKCRDFCSQLHKVLHSDYFNKLFEECDNFLKEIRCPFMLTLLALWSLSLLYLLHIAVVRLDVLRIRSHLRSPSSHRIAAQSLLATARVRALANVKYFSP
ncbi:hypothetical protein, conserved [Babesia ovata]|uniref:C3H1-type domain-containing protein n=1 Tax=Babesia ovata TaxID=189622 RepID=A0A2H6KKE4_9APIC|nr:uncharacterized protein BOVATA_049530 [Babesia ovata]GBE63460.1 hypothetical protein, conserved [Babesia ovata]